MEEDLIALIIADAGVSAIFKAVASSETRIYWMRAPQGVAKPYATLQRISGVPDNPHGGPSGLEAARVQIDVYGLTYAATITAARAIVDLLTGFRGTKNSTVFQGIFRSDWREGFEHDATPDKLFRQSVDIEIWHKGA